MKTITIKRRRRMTKHRKGMTKPRKSNRRIKNRKHKTRRQSGGWGWKSFIQAGDNQLKIVFDNNPFLLLHMVAGKNKGIDVKFKRESSGNCVWLIGNTDKTFKELRDGAKDGRYQTFINVLLEKHPYFNRFETLKEDRDSSKGIILTDKLFCEMFINEPFVLDYPRLREKFNSSGFKCTSSGPSSASAAGTGAAPAPRGPSAAPAPPPSAAGTSAAFRARGPSSAAPSAASIPSSYAKAILQIAAADSGVSAAGTVRGGPSAALSAAPTRAPTRATIQDFLQAQAGNFPSPPHREAVALRAPTSAEPAWVAQLKEMGYIQSQINQALVAGIKTANDAIAHISSMSQAPEQAFPVRNLSFTPMIADLMFPDEFVTKYANAHGLHFEQKESYYQDIRGGRTLNKFTTKCPDVAKWTVMYTIGDGNCLTHAFLQCMSSKYRKIPNTEIQAEKTGVARAFRLAFADINPEILDKTEAMNDLLNKDGMTDLGEETFASYARLFGVILVVFDVHNTQVIVANLTKETAIQTMPVIFMHGDGGHFSSVLPPPIHSVSNEPFVLTYEYAKQIRCLNETLTFPNDASLNK